MHLSSALATFSFSDFSALAAFIASLDAREKRPAANVITLSGAVARDDSGEAEAFKAAMAKVATARRGNGITLPDAVAAPAVTRSSARALTAGETTLPKLKVDWALWCAARGLRVFPAKWESPSRKKPIIEGWQYLATVEPAQITEWWAKWPDADIGIALGQGILVIDIDVKNGKPGLKSLAKLGIALDDTLCSVTWSGGYHQFYADPDAYMNTVGFLPGLDCKSKGGMVLGPGSFRGLYKLLHEKPIAPLPEALKRHLTPAKDIQPPEQFVELDEPENVEAAIRWLKEEAPIAVQHSHEGGNNTLYRAAAELTHERAISEDLAFQLMLEHYNERCDPPWSEGEMGNFTKTFYSAAKGGKGDIGTKTREGMFGDSVKHVPQPTLPTHTSPAALVDDGGLDTITAADAVRKPREWLIKGKIPYGFTTIWAGHPCIGKSTSLMALVACFTNRVPLPVTGEILEPVDVLLFSKEQDESTIRSQAEAAGVDLNRLHIVIGKPVAAKNGKKSKRFDIAADVGRIEVEIRKKPRIRVVIFDPVLAYVNGKLENNNPVAVRDAVDDLVELAKELRLAVILVSHLTKSAPLGNVPAWTQITGSGAWTALCRAGFLIREDENNPGRILILNAKPSLTGDKSGWAYRIESHIFADGDEVGKAIFEGSRVEESADQVVNGRKPVNNVEFVRAQSLFLDALAKYGKISRSRLLMLAAEEDISESTLEKALRNTPHVKEKIGTTVEYALPKSHEDAAREAFGRVVPVPPAAIG